MVTEFLTAKEVSPMKIHRCLNSAYGEHTIAVSTDIGSGILKVVKRQPRQAPKLLDCNSSDNGQQELYQCAD